MNPHDVLAELEPGTPKSTRDLVTIVPISVSRHLAPVLRRFMSLLGRSAGPRVMLPGDRLYFLARSELRNRTRDRIKGKGGQGPISVLPEGEGK